MPRLGWDEEYYRVRERVPARRAYMRKWYEDNKVQAKVTCSECGSDYLLSTQSIKRNERLGKSYRCMSCVYQENSRRMKEAAMWRRERAKVEADIIKDACLVQVYVRKEER